jgi:hypothetical protein
MTCTLTVVRSQRNPLLALVNFSSRCITYRPMGEMAHLREFLYCGCEPSCFLLKQPRLPEALGCQLPSGSMMMSWAISAHSSARPIFGSAGCSKCFRNGGVAIAIDSLQRTGVA